MGILPTNGNIEKFPEAELASVSNLRLARIAALLPVTLKSLELQYPTLGIEEPAPQGEVISLHEPRARRAAAQVLDGAARQESQAEQLLNEARRNVEAA